MSANSDAPKAANKAPQKKAKSKNKAKVKPVKGMADWCAGRGARRPRPTLSAAAAGRHPEHMALRESIFATVRHAFRKHGCGPRA